MDDFEYKIGEKVYRIFLGTIMDFDCRILGMGKYRSGRTWYSVQDSKGKVRRLPSSQVRSIREKVLGLLPAATE